MNGFRIMRDGEPDLDARDLEVVDTAMNMRGESYFYTVSRIMREFDIDEGALAMADLSAKECLDGVWKVAAALGERHGNEVASLFLSSFMAAMTLEIVDHTLLSKLFGEAEEILKEDDE